MSDSPRTRILIVDDESAIRKLERRILEKAEHVILEAADAATALSMLEREPVLDLLIADLDMPGMSGEEMVRRIHATRPHQKVLYVTANIDRLLDVRSLIWEGEAFLEKPFTPKGLLEAVSLLLTGTLSGTPIASEPVHRSRPLEWLFRPMRLWRDQ